MAKYDFQRETRTPHSECYIVMQDDNVIGRLDLHFADPVVHATLNVDEIVTSDGVQDIIDDIEAELLDAVGIRRQEIIIHVHQGRDLGVYSTSDFEGTNGGGIRFN
jgi:hypothetical protein